MDVRVIAGVTHHGTTGPVSGVVTKPLYLDVNLSPETSFEELIPQGHAGFVFVIEGEISVKSDTASKTVSTKQLGVLGPGNAVNIESRASSARFLLVAAQILDEPIARYGPFVMNTRTEIEQAITDFNAGKF